MVAAQLVSGLGKECYINLSCSWLKAEDGGPYISRLLKKALSGCLLEALDVLVQQTLLLEEDAHGCRRACSLGELLIGVTELGAGARGDRLL